MRSLLLRYLFPRLSAALMRLAWISGGLPKTNQPKNNLTMARLTPEKAVEIAQTAFDTITLLKSSNASLKEAFAPLAADNESLKAKLAELEADDAVVDAALSSLSQLLNPVDVPPVDVPPVDAPPVDAPPADVPPGEVEDEIPGV